MISSFSAERYRPAMPGGGATGASLSAVALAEAEAAGVPLTGIRSGGGLALISSARDVSHNL